jgi:mannosyltransferase OCH1-like enzyme
MIPKIIYQTWYDKKNIPIEYTKIIQHNKNLNPDFTFILYDDQDLEQLFHNENDFIKTAYFRINPHYGPSRSDLFRYYIIYTNGGIYLDIKIKCKIPFDHYITNNNTLLVSYWEGLYYNKNILNNQKGELQNWHIISNKNNIILKKVFFEIIHFINNLSIIDCQTIKGKLGVLYTTGPIIYTQIIEKNMEYVKIFDSRNYLDYGTSFFGINIHNYTHYSNLNEPIFLNKYISIPIIIFKHYNFNHPGIYIFYDFILLNDPIYLLWGCNAIFCKNKKLYFLAFDSHIIISDLIDFINNIIDNEEKIYYFNNFCIKQIKINDNILSFHFKKFFLLFTSSIVGTVLGINE